MIPCTLRQLEIFLAAAEDCHFARTADRLGISQPAVTTHIAALERELGKQLFVRRRGTTPILSSDGAMFLVQAKSFLAEGEKIRAFRSDVAARDRTRVRVVAGAHILEDCIRPRLSDFYREHPTIAVECTLVETMAKGFRLLERGAADVLLFSSSRTSMPPFHSEVLRPIRFALYASPTFEAHRAATAEELSKLPFVLPPEGSEATAMIETALAQVGIAAAVVSQRAQYSDVIIDLAVAGFGVAAAFETMVVEQLRRGELIEFDLKLSPRHRTMFRRGGTPSKSLVAVEGFLRSILAA